MDETPATKEAYLSVHKYPDNRMRDHPLFVLPAGFIFFFLDWPQLVAPFVGEQVTRHLVLHCYITDNNIRLYPQEE